MYNRTKAIWIVICIAVAALLIAIAFQATQPTGTAGKAEISFAGLVDHPYSFDLEEIESMPRVTVTAELICVSGNSFGIHEWTGVRLSYLLNATGVQDTAIKVAFYATDGYVTDLTMEDAMRSDVIVAYLKDGSQMSEKTRLVVPGMWGYKWIAGIETIKLVDYNFMGDWEGRGYPDDANF